MKKEKRKEIFRTFIFIFCLSVVCGGGVSAVYSHSKNKIALNQRVKLQRAILEASGILAVDSGKTPEQVQGLFNKRVVKQRNMYVCDNKITVYPVAGPGLWGEIKAVIGLEKDHKTISGIAFTYQNETPGLGGRITEPAFRKQFIGKKLPVTIASRGEKAQQNTFDAITGATVTSNGVKSIINSLNGKKTAE